MKYELRSWRVEEYTEFYRFTRVEQLSYYVFDTFPTTVRQCHDWVVRCCRPDSRQCFRAILANGRIVGCIGLRVGDNLYRRSGELFFWLCKVPFACEFMASLIHQFTDEMFCRYNLTRIYSRPLCSQPTPQCLLKKAGYCLEGKMCNFICIGDDCVDACLYAICRKTVFIDYCC